MLPHFIIAEILLIFKGITDFNNVLKDKIRFDFIVICIYDTFVVILYSVAK
jgi:hypothetical protein